MCEREREGRQRNTTMMAKQQPDKVIKWAKPLAVKDECGSTQSQQPRVFLDKKLTATDMNYCCTLSKKLGYCCHCYALFIVWVQSETFHCSTLDLQTLTNSLLSQIHCLEWQCK